MKICSPGETVYIIDKNKDGSVEGIAEYTFLMQTGQFAVVADVADVADNSKMSLDGMLYWLAEENRNLNVFPLDDCYATRQQAKTAESEEIMEYLKSWEIDPKEWEAFMRQYNGGKHESIYI